MQIVRLVHLNSKNFHISFAEIDSLFFLRCILYAPFSLNLLSILLLHSTENIHLKVYECAQLLFFFLFVQFHVNCPDVHTATAKKKNYSLEKVYIFFLASNEDAEFMHKSQTKLQTSNNQFKSPKNHWTIVNRVTFSLCVRLNARKQNCVHFSQGVNLMRE